MRKGVNTQNGKVKEYHSSSGALDKNKAGSTLNFGVWDDRDNHGMVGQKENPLNKSQAKPKQLNDGKLSKTIGRRGTLFVLRPLLIVFSFLGSWTKLL